MPEKHIKNGRAEHSQNNKHDCSQFYCLPALKRHIFAWLTLTEAETLWARLWILWNTRRDHPTGNKQTPMSLKLSYSKSAAAAESWPTVTSVKVEPVRMHAVLWLVVT